MRPSSWSKIIREGWADSQTQANKPINMDNNRFIFYKCL